MTISAPPTSPANPEFLGAHFAAGGRMRDVRLARQTFTLSEEAVAYRGYVQRWELIQPLIDIDGQLQSRLLSHQERHQTNVPFYVPVPQDPDISDEVDPTTTATVARKVNRLQTTMLVELSQADRIYPRWFFTLAGDSKVYYHAGLTFYNKTTAQANQPFLLYPELRKTVEAGTALTLFPQMYVRYNDIIAINEAVIDRRKVKVITVRFIEVLQYG